MVSKTSKTCYDEYVIALEKCLETVLLGGSLSAKVALLATTAARPRSFGRASDCEHTQTSRVLMFN